MSFSTEVKKELLNNEYNESVSAFVAGICQGGVELILSEGKIIVRISSFMPSLIRFLVPYFKKQYGVVPQTFYLDRTNINKKRIYCLDITDNVDKIIKDFHLYPYDFYEIQDPLFASEKAKRAFVAGCFITKGSISDPRKSSYHFEILFKKPEIAAIVSFFLDEEGIISSIIPKLNQTLLYIKKSESISNALAFMDAYSGVLHFEDYRIMRDMNNSVNRAMNCDIANYKRSLEYCKKQLEAIAYIKKRGADKKMSLRLQDAMRLREAYPDSTLFELSELSENILGKHLSKSGISHCMSEIMSYYNYLVNN